MPNELKPCPFCGNTARLCHTTDNKHSPFVACDGAVQANGTKSCFACLYPWRYETDEEAIEAWNRRVDND